MQHLNISISFSDYEAGGLATLLPQGVSPVPEPGVLRQGNQAVAIGLSEARRKGAKIPKKKAA